MIPIESTFVTSSYVRVPPILMLSETVKEVKSKLVTVRIPAIVKLPSIF